MDNSLQTAIQKMGSNFLVASFVPSMAFIVISYIAFHPIFPTSFQYPSNDLPALLQSSIIFLLLTTILGFTLYTLGTYIYKAFEGYTFILGINTGLRKSFLKRQVARFRKVSSRKIRVHVQLEKVKKKIEKEKHDPIATKWRNKRLNRLSNQKYALEGYKYNLTSEIEYNFPSSEQLIMPTRFGNVLHAAELYSNRYGIDAVPIWTKLVCAMPNQDNMMEKINEANNQCQFLLNGALLAILFSILCLLAIVYEVVQSHSPITTSLSTGLPLVYLLLMFASVGLARFFYEASLLNVSQFGSIIRASYDLYRFQLLEALHLELPPSLNEERKLWVKLSHFMTGNLDYKEDNEITSEDTIDFSYSHPLKNN